MLTMEFPEGVTALWTGLTDRQLDKIALYIEREFKYADSVGG